MSSPPLLCLLAPLLLASTPPRPMSRLEDAPQDTFSGVERIVAVGDVHGDASALEDVLRLAGLINAQGHWVGGKAHLVQTGDVDDRGDHTREAFELLMRLEREARAAGGQVHALLGNHEVMNMLGDLRYTTAGERASFADQSPEPDGDAPRGTHGHQAAYGPEGRYGLWLRAHPAVIRINDTLFLHGGLAPGLPMKTLGEVNQWVRQDLFPGQSPGGGKDNQGPLWYRGYALGPDAEEGPALQQVLERFGARRMVMGHTTQGDGKIHARFGGRAVFIDTGVSSYAGRHLAALEIRGDTVTALYAGGHEAPRE